MRFVKLFMVFSFLFSTTIANGQAELELDLQEMSSLQLAIVFQKVFPNYSQTHKVDKEIKPADRSLIFRNRQEKSEIGEVRIKIVKQSSIKAFSLSNANPPTIVLSSALLEKLPDDAQIAFIIAHEMAHLKMKHIALDIPDIIFTQNQLEQIYKIRKQWEFDADNFALERITQAGFSASTIARVLNNLKVAALESKSEQTGRNHRAHHPDIEKRIAVALAKLP